MFKPEYQSFCWTSWSTEIQELATLPDWSQNIEFRVDEGEVNVFKGSITSVQDSRLGKRTFKDGLSSIVALDAKDSSICRHISRLSMLQSN